LLLLSDPQNAGQKFGAAADQKCEHQRQKDDRRGMEAQKARALVIFVRIK
jgi:hypothetical protein